MQHVLKETLNNQRQEAAADSRGLPPAYTRAVKALDGNCTHCSERAITANGAGVGLCALHQRQRDARDPNGVRQRERLRRQIDMALQEHI